MCDNLQSKWAAAEGDSVSGGNGTGHIYLPVIDGAGEGSEPGEMVLSQVLSTLFHWSFIHVCLRLFSQKTVLSLERLLSATPGASSIIRILGVALIT